MNNIIILFWALFTIAVVLLYIYFNDKRRDVKEERQIELLFRTLSSKNVKEFYESAQTTGDLPKIADDNVYQELEEIDPNEFLRALKENEDYKN